MLWKERRVIWNARCVGGWSDGELPRIVRAVLAPVEAEEERRGCCAVDIGAGVGLKSHFELVWVVNVSL